MIELAKEVKKLVSFQDAAVTLLTSVLAITVSRKFTVTYFIGKQIQMHKRLNILKNYNSWSVLKVISLIMKGFPIYRDLNSLLL